MFSVSREYDSALIRKKEWTYLPKYKFDKYDSKFLRDYCNIYKMIRTLLFYTHFAQIFPISSRLVSNLCFDKKDSHDRFFFTLIAPLVENCITAHFDLSSHEWICSFFHSKILPWLILCFDKKFQNRVSKFNQTDFFVLLYDSSTQVKNR